jgi:UDP-N-acetylglucosamine--N-acetylmuramyl-(pentapeptide) pyrophosphoryl-undecaprenol N-acetylglucosamine transferase
MNHAEKSKKIVIVAGGTGGHVFPALACGQELKRQCPDVALQWVGTDRSRERELCNKNAIPFRQLTARGLVRSLSPRNVGAALDFLRGTMTMRTEFRRERPTAVIAFGGYVCAPVLMAARLSGVPYFLQEQNTVPGLVNRLFASGARCSFLGFELAGRKRLAGATRVTGTPVRQVSGRYDGFAYPTGFNRSKTTVLISGGSQGAASMNTALIEPVKRIIGKGIQVVWQTGAASNAEIIKKIGRRKNAFIFESIDDLYPFYSRARCVVCRAGASTLSEAAYFGLPCVMVPLPWAAENHQWINAGLVESQGWGVRVAQSEQCGEKVLAAVTEIITDDAVIERMSRQALNNSPVNAATDIVKAILEMVER